MEPLHVDRVLSDLCKLLHRLAGPHVDLVVECEDDLPPVRFDQAVLRRVVVDLVRNASDVLADEGRIAVRASASTGRVVLTVADTGPGRPVERLPGVFEPFHVQRVGAAGAESGLAAVHEVVVANGADIRVASTPGGGAKFSIYLPVWA
ncbi:MAG TPA: ATP-binding protein [Gaiellaceae bacterium]|nr:ATP-binding protein [Gaiellaceae bacterium]